MLINTFLDTEDFVHLYYPEDETPPPVQGCSAGARMSSKYPRPPSPPSYDKITSSSSEMSERERTRAPPPPEPPPHRVRAADLYPRVRTHYDEPGLDVPFTPICAEFVQWVGRTSDNCTLAMSNYRFHVQPRRRTGFGTSVPIRMIDAVEVRDLIHLIVLCKDGKTLKCTFNTGEQCLEWWRRLTTALTPSASLSDTFAAAYAAWAREMPPKSVHRAMIMPTAPARSAFFRPEFDRLGFANEAMWRVTAANSDYKLCPSYPPLLIVPSSIEDSELEAVARFRAMRRIPTVVWRHRANGAVLARSSQPEVGWLGWRSSEDERLLAAMAPHKGTKLLIMDARSYASAVTNRARGGGCECAQYYPGAEIQFMCLSNIHHVRKSFQQLRQLFAEPPDQANWLCALERSLWPQYVSGMGLGALAAARALRRGRSVLVHCSDGWDRTPQLVAGAELLLDPYYRTSQGFRILVEREWLSFGHKFASRCGHALGPEEPNERAPIFLQWLDFVHQCMLQYPTSFEFTEAYLLKLLTHVHSCMFGTFLCNSAKERSDLRVSETTADVWRLLQGAEFKNHLYTPPSGDQEIWPDLSVRAIVPWWALFGTRPQNDHSDTLLPTNAHSNGVMTKTRSCDNLLIEAEKRTLQRRCSDPSLAPDVMKLSSILPSSSSSSSIGRAPRPLADSFIDTSLLRNNDQVDGIGSQLCSDNTSPGRDMSDPDPEPDPEPDGDTRLGLGMSHVVLPRDLTSNSSSLEREIVNNNLHAAQEAARECARQRNISITWRSLSESSHHTDSSIDIAPHHNNKHITTDGSEIANGNGNGTVTTTANGTDSSDHNLDLHSIEQHLRTTTIEAPSSSSSSGSSSSWTGEVGGRGARLERARRRLSARTAQRRTHGVSRSSSSVPTCVCGLSSQWEGGSVRTRGCVCVCGWGGAGRRDSPDGLPPHADPIQSALHSIILSQRMMVEELSKQLVEARAALQQRLSSPPPHHYPATLELPTAPQRSPDSPSGDVSPETLISASSPPRSAALSAIPVGEEAREGRWVPDSAAPRCQHCSHHFWLARRRHHCRKCGGIFCGSCSEMRWERECGATVRVCRRCRAVR